MIVLSNLSTQVIAPGQAVTFDNLVLKSGNCECWSRQLPNSTKLKAQGIYGLGFSGNVSVATVGQSAQLAIAVAGQPLVETTMISTPSTADALNNISTETRYRNCCCDMDRISVINTGTAPVTLAANSALVIERKS